MRHASNLIDHLPMSEHHPPECPICHSPDMSAIAAPVVVQIPEDERADSFQCDHCGAVFTLLHPRDMDHPVDAGLS